MTALDPILAQLSEEVRQTPAEDTGDKDYTSVAVQFLLSPGDAGKLLNGPLDYRPALERELSRKAYRSMRYCRALYAPDDDEALADVIADLTFAQLDRKPIIKKNRPGDEADRATAFVLGVYTLFALAVGSRAGFRPLFSLAWRNYYQLLGSRSVRRSYDPSWHSRYSLRNVFYPLG
ncbi:MAG: hypothetical protein IJ721_10040 [Bacteroidales bacterium]|nr:hypothetical protein [Bacteroidales bacterium]